MIGSKAQLSDAASTTLARWRELLTSRRLAELTSVLAADAAFHSPVGLKPYPGRELVALVLGTASEVFEGFTYCAEMIGDNRATLVFDARVEGMPVRGVHVLQFDDAGQIVDVEKWIRPAKAAIALGNAVGDRAGERIRALRDKKQP